MTHKKEPFPSLPPTRSKNCVSSATFTGGPRGNPPDTSSKQSVVVSVCVSTYMFEIQVLSLACLGKDDGRFCATKNARAGFLSSLIVGTDEDLPVGSWAAAAAVRFASRSALLLLLIVLRLVVLLLLLLLDVVRLLVVVLIVVLLVLLLVMLVVVLVLLMLLLLSCCCC